MELGVGDSLMQPKKYFLSIGFVLSTGDGTGLTELWPQGSLVSRLRLPHSSHSRLQLMGIVVEV